MPAKLTQIVPYADRLLKHAEIGDWSTARNGLQVANSGKISRIGAAVDAHLQTFQKAVRQKVDFLVVHHGLFWSDIAPITGANYDKIKLLIDHDIALYSSHLPLDLHPKFGNNILLARQIGLKKMKPFARPKGQYVGKVGECSISLERLITKLEKILGQKPLLLPGGPKQVKKIGILTGAAGDALMEAAEAGADTFITGEGSHGTFAAAFEAGINVLYGGHYLTETFGVKALAKHLSKTFSVPWEFLDTPSGL